MFFAQSTASAARCIMQWPNLADANNPHLIITPADWCDYGQWELAGYPMGSVPNPFPPGNDTCIAIPADDSSLQIVNCGSQPYVNAVPYDPTIHDTNPDPNNDIIESGSEAWDFCEEIGGRHADSSGRPGGRCHWQNPGIPEPECTPSLFDKPECVVIVHDQMYGKTKAEITAIRDLLLAAAQQSAQTQPSGADGVPVDCTRGVDSANCRAVSYLVYAINIASATVAIVIVGSIIAAGIQYSSARDDPQAIAKAKHRILMAVIALALFIFGFTFLQWLVPGGIL
jgi:hypothetical protein